MGLRSTLSSLLTAPVAQAIEARVRQLVDAALEARDLVDPTRVRDLAVEIERTRRTADEIRGELARLRDAVGALGDARGGEDDLAVLVAGLTDQDATLTATLDGLQARVTALADLVVEVRRAVEGAERRGAEPATAPVEAAAATPDRGCKVPDCTSEHRARGFCGRHYQMWKRGTLPGFVNADGSVFFEGDARRFVVELDLAGEPAEPAPRGLKVGGKRVTAKAASPS